MKRFTCLLLAAMAVLSLGLSGCGSSASGSAPGQSTGKTVTINGALEPGAAKATLKTAGAATASIGTVTALDAATGAVISVAPVNVIPDSTGTGGTFSGLTITAPSSQAGVILRVVLNNGTIYRALVTSDLSTQTGPLSATIGPNSDAVVTSVSSSLGISGVLGDSGVKVPAGTKLADVAAAVTTAASSVLPKLQTGYVVDTGGSSPAVPGISLIDRVSQTVVKTVRFTNQAGTRIGHFANVTADGSELWSCSGQGGATGVVNVFDTAAFRNFSTLNDSNKGSFIKKSFAVGCGVQNVQSPDGKYIFISADQSPKGINVFDVKNHAYLGNIANGNTAPHVGAVSADGKKYYTTTAGSYHAVGYDISGLPASVPTDANKILDVNLGYGSLHALRLHPNGKYLFVGNNTWPVPAGVTTPTSGTNVIDIATQKIIATIPGRPHNYAISPDGKYLLVTELSSPDCEVSLPGDPGNRLQFIDISTLLTANPDPSKIADIYHFNTPGYGGSHASWDPTTGTLYYSVYDTTNQGWLILLNTSGLSAATPSVAQIGSFIKIGWAPHGVLFPGINGD
ncbi:hypothetical protein F6V30_09635 [Oryzomonas sagensis]|uniref:DNA-binding beta-propeller fold protein YncE n=1 Tax=Oryzomonas sagensis TaxID=2603857 RepID=A0ABQ6TP45_9BACT|nr:hypothetical protein [Oryzomonas sagensis]KAB0670403.1 hypothetical protein F6V30_09635 [Oryzomonas sagensis]